MWFLLIYEIATTTVEVMERKVGGYLRRWLGVPPSFTSIGLDSNSIQQSLPVTSVVEDFKVAKCRLVMTLRNSADNRMAGAGIQTRTGRRWSAKTSVGQAQSMLQLRDIIGNTNTGRQGKGISHFQQWSKASAAERRTMVLAKMRRTEEDQRKAKSTELEKQGAWTKWDLPERDLHGQRKKDQFRISFLLRSVYDTLPSPVGSSRRPKLQAEKS